MALRTEARISCNYPSQTILDTLKFCNILDSNIVMEGIAVIKSAANERKEAEGKSPGDVDSTIPVSTCRKRTPDS